MELCAQQPIEQDLLVEQLHSSDSDERRSAVFALSRFPRQQVFPYLVTALQDEKRGVREAASEVIQQQPAEESAEQLVFLLGSPRIEVRNLVAEILTNFGHLATPALITALKDGNEDERKFAADILGAIGDRRAVTRLSWVAENDQVDNVAISAIEAMGKIGSAEALPLLMFLFHARPHFRPTITEAMGLIGSPESVPFLEQHLAIDDPIVAFGIVDALGNLGQASSLQVLLSFFESARGELRHQTAKAILKIAQKAQVDILGNLPAAFWNSIANLLMERDQEVEDLIIYHIQHSPSASVLIMMGQMLSIAPEHLLLTFINMVKGRPEFFNLLTHLCYHTNPNVAYAAVESLESYPREAIVSHLKDIFNRVEGLPLIAAMKIVAAQQLVEFIPLVQALCSNDDLDVQAMAEGVLMFLRKE